MHQWCVCLCVCSSSRWTVGGPLSVPPECVDGWLPTRVDLTRWLVRCYTNTFNFGTFMTWRCSLAGGCANSHSWSCLFPGLPHSRPIYPLWPLKSLQRAGSCRASAADHLTAVMHSSARLKVTFIIFFPLILSQACDTRITCDLEAIMVSDQPVILDQNRICLAPNHVADAACMYPGLTNPSRHSLYSWAPKTRRLWFTSARGRLKWTAGPSGSDLLQTNNRQIAE